MTSTNHFRNAVLLALFLSGLAGLMHEIAWTRLLAHLIGSTAYAQAVVLSVFMGGLALGAVLFGRRADRNASPLRAYVVLEVVILLYGAALPWITEAVGSLYRSQVASSFESEGARLTWRVLLAAVAVLPPAVCMGGTLPLAARALIGGLAETRRAVASLYACNNLGAMVGAGVAGFITLPSLGIQSTLIVAALFNGLAAWFAWAASKDAAGAREQAPEATPTDAGPRYGQGAYTAALAGLFLSGFAAMAYEVVFNRTIALALGSATYSFTLMLMSFIGGIGLGSWFTAGRVQRAPLASFAVTQVLVVISMLGVALFGLERLGFWVSNLRIATVPLAGGFSLYLAGQGALCFAVMGLPTFFLGASFPLAAQIRARSMDDLGARVGSTYAWNTVGNVVGVVLTSLWLLPELGLGGALAFALAANALAVAILAAAAAELGASLRPAIALFGVALTLGAWYAPRAWAHTLTHAVDHYRLREGPLATDSDAVRDAHASSSLESWKRAYVQDAASFDRMFTQDDPDNTVLAMRKDRTASLCVNSKSDASTTSFDMVTQLVIAHLPALFALEAVDACVIGYGSGVTVGALLAHPLERVDVAEISGGVLAADPLFADFNRGAMADPRTHVWREDGRTFLRTVPRQYDIIVSEPSNPWIAGIGALFTREFFEEARAKLKPKGVLCMWFHQYESDDRTVELVVRTLSHVFPHVQVSLSYYYDAIAVASMEPLTPDFSRIEQRLERAEVRKDLARVGIFNLATLFSFHWISPQRFALLAGEGELNTDDRERLQYLGAANVFLGRDSDYLLRQAPTPGPDGKSDSLFDHYLEWRAQGGDPVSASELSTAYASLNSMFPQSPGQGPNVMIMRARFHAERALASNSTPTLYARGKQPPLLELDAREAFNRGGERLVQNDMASAEALFRRSLEALPGFALALRSLSSILFAQDRPGEVVQAARAALAHNPHDVDIKLVLAQALFQQGDAQQSATLWEEVLQVGPNSEALTMLGVLATQANDAQRALHYFGAALHHDPTCWQAGVPMVRILASTEQSLPLARQILTDLASVVSGQPEVQALQQELAATSGPLLPAPPDGG